MFFLLSFFVFWLASVTVRMLFWTHVWQVKEYRFDRLIAEFYGRRFFRLLLPAPALIKGGLFAVGGLAGLLFDPARLGFIGWITLLYYLIEDARMAFARAVRLPVWTAKAMLVLGIGFVLLAGALGSGVFAGDLALAAPEARLGVTLVLVLADIAVPFFISLSVLIMKAPTALVRTWLMRRAALHRARLEHLLVIGITGSYGKTSTKEFLGTILEKHFRVAKVPDHINAEIGLARFILDQVNETHEVLIAEMGAYRRGDIRRLAAMARPQIGVITGINEQHIALFGGIEETKRAKYELIEALPEKGLALFNADSPGSRELYEHCDRPKKLFSAGGEAVDCYAEDIRMETAGEHADDDTHHDAHRIAADTDRPLLVFQLKSPGESRTCKVPLFGYHHVPNIVAAAAVAHAMGMSLEDIRDRVQYLNASAHTMNLCRTADGRVVIDDTYSANPTGVAAALESLRFFAERKKILVMPSLIELGSASDQIHEMIGKKAAEICDLVILTTFAGFAALARGIGSAERIAFEPDPRKILRIIEHETAAGDVILLESRVPDEVRKALLNPNAKVQMSNQ